MKITSARFIKSALKPEHYPKDRLPEIAFVGRSNVGKSTLLNTLLGQKGLAKTSSTPGKTQTINFFLVNERFYFVDLPGYGFAKVPKQLKDQWNEVMRAYLQERSTLRLTVLLLDSRHEPSPLDAHMLHLLEDAEVPTLVVATKIDKLNQSERRQNLSGMRRSLELDEQSLVVPFSALKGDGAKELWRIIDDVLGNSVSP